MSIVKALVSKGNKKLPKKTWIFNSGAATDCPSRKLGLCQAGSLCYAMKAEKMYPKVLPYRRKQFQITQTVDPKAFALHLLAESKRSTKNPMRAFRFNESGDFVNQAQLDWFTAVCRVLKSKRVSCYGYTARTDLDLSRLLKVATVQVSNDLHGWIEQGANRFKMVDEPSPLHLECAGDCRICKLCQTQKGKIIQVEQH